ncbi:hypothetical protein J5N97_030012 [Dioscorea zingiberensis]|uniref:Transposase (putative) gypsy type domain-containing protein n=1 Tax=Dioscorea zingiberensis TaxID=325984 RepID=A0A9D5BWV9_9LILI|nr:hypothetical protein J5N97_030012 [Dioscorea zingiberensis]
MASDATSSSSGSSHESHEAAVFQPLSISSPSNPMVSAAIPGESRDIPVQGLRIHPASRAMGKGSGTFISLLGQKDVDSLVEKYEIDSFLFEVRVPCSKERVSSPREGEIAIYQDALLGGLRLPFPDFTKAIPEEYHLCPSQLTPNSWRLLNGFVIVFKNYGVNPTVHWFRMLFSLCSESNTDWYYFSARSGRKFLGKVASSIMGWKSKFFFVKSKSEWDFRTKWEVPRTNITCEEMTKEEEVLLKSMTGISKVYMDEFLTKENLLKCRLIVSAGNPMEDEDLSYVKGILASFEGEVVAALEGKEKEQLVVIRTLEQDKDERLQQLAAMEKEKDDLAAKLTISEGSLHTAAENIKKLQDDSSSLKEELKSAQEEQGEARWDLKLKVAKLATVRAELEELKGEGDTLKEDLASRQKTPKSDSQEMKDLIEPTDKSEKEVARLRAKAKEGATRIYSVLEQVGHHVSPAEVLTMGLAGVLNRFTELKEQQIIKIPEALA